MSDPIHTWDYVGGHPLTINATTMATDPAPVRIPITAKGVIGDIALVANSALGASDEVSLQVAVNGTAVKTLTIDEDTGTAVSMQLGIIREVNPGDVVTLTLVDTGDSDPAVAIAGVVSFLPSAKR